MGFRVAKEKQTTNMLDLLDTNPVESASADPWAVPQPPRPKVSFYSQIMKI